MTGTADVLQPIMTAIGDIRIVVELLQEQHLVQPEDGPTLYLIDRAEQHVKEATERFDGGLRS